jgi:hypothetical protein
MFGKIKPTIMRKILSALAMLIAIFPAFSQHDSLLKNFKYRIDHYRAINFNLGTGGNYSNPNLQPDYNASSFSGNFSVFYYALKSTDKKLSSASAGLDGSFSSNRSASQFGVSKQRYFNVVPTASTLTKYYSSKNNFVELGGSLSAYGNINNVKDRGETIWQKSDRSQYDIILNLGIGKGRLENITDMQNALWLNEALKRAGRLSRTLNPEELNGLGQAITKGNNTRVLDARKRTQFILETVDGYLQLKNLVSNTDIHYFTNLNDILFFAFNNNRMSGVEKFIRLTPSVSGGSTNDETPANFQKTTSKFDIQDAVLNIGFSAYKPSGLVHQNNYGASIVATYGSANYTDRFYTNNVLSGEFIRPSELYQSGVHLFYEHSIYPNTRTSVNFRLQTENGYQYQNKHSDFYSNSGLIAAATYFISYRTRFYFNAGAIYQKNFYQPTGFTVMEVGGLNLYANAGLSINI